MLNPPDGWPHESCAVSQVESPTACFCRGNIQYSFVLFCKFSEPRNRNKESSCGRFHLGDCTRLMWPAIRRIQHLVMVKTLLKVWAMISRKVENQGNLIAYCEWCLIRDLRKRRFNFGTRDQAGFCAAEFY